MSAIEQFIKALERYEKIHLIGPMLSVHTPPTPCSPTIYIDGGLAFYQGTSSSKWPIISIGDGDSLAEQSSNLKLDKLLPRHKNFSDFKYALSIIPSHIKLVDCTGLSGGRMDHYLCILGEINQFLLQRKKTLVTLDHDTLAFNFPLTLDFVGDFSVLSLEYNQVTIQGAASYPLLQQSELRPFSSLGLSNSAKGKIKVEGRRPLFLLKPLL